MLELDDSTKMTSLAFTKKSTRNPKSFTKTTSTFNSSPITTTTTVNKDPSNNGRTISKQINYSRYKTEMCRQYSENGECKYGDKCQFAHGLGELKDISRHPKYKTDFCKTFHSKGFCPYGPRCHFIHELNEKYDPSASNTSTPTVSIQAVNSKNKLSLIQLDESSPITLFSSPNNNYQANNNNIPQLNSNLLNSSPSSSSSSSSQSPSPNSYISSSSSSSSSASSRSSSSSLSNSTNNTTDSFDLNFSYQAINQLNDLISSLFNININEPPVVPQLSEDNLNSPSSKLIKNR